MASGMGIGSYLQDGAIIKRKFRWTLGFGPIGSSVNTTDTDTGIPPIMVTIAARPNLTIEETELNFMNEKDFIPAKPTWDPLQVTFLDYAKIGGNGADSQLLKWVRACYWFGNPTKSGQMSDPVGQCRRTATLTMTSGTGSPLEIWTIYGCWIQQSNWGDLDYSSTDNATLEATVRFQNADCLLVPGVSELAAEGDSSNNHG